MDKIVAQIASFNKASNKIALYGGALSLASITLISLPSFIKLQFLLQIMIISLITVLGFIVMKFTNKKYFTRTLILEQNDPLFSAYISYLRIKGIIDTDFLKRAVAALEYKSRDRDNHYVDQNNLFEKQDKLKEKPKINYIPAEDSKEFVYKGHQITIQQTLNQCQSRILILHTPSSFRILKQLSEEVLSFSLDKEKDLTQIFNMVNGRRWEKVFLKTPRTIESVILPQDKTDMIIQDVKKFFKREHWYQDRGVPYRRGYLLYGPPGSGKTSFVYALAGLLKMNICVVSLNSRYLSDENLMRLLHSTPPKSIILLEDVDTLYDHRARINQSRVTFSGFLNCIDGILAQEGHILFMTTNHRENLDPALIRPGRADLHVKLDFAQREQMVKLFLNFFQGENRLAKEFSEKIPEYEASMAQLQGHFMKYNENAQEALDNYEEVLEAIEERKQEEIKKEKELKELEKERENDQANGRGGGRGRGRRRY